MANPHLVHALGDRRLLVEGSLQVRQVVFFPVVVRHPPVRVARGRLSDVGEAPLHQRQHVLRRRRVVQPPLPARRHVHRRGVREDPPPPAVMVRRRDPWHPGLHPGVAGVEVV